jgi:hypothetical protein
MVPFFLLFSVEYKYMMLYRTLDGFSWNLRCFFFSSLCIYCMAVFRMYVKLCSTSLFSDGGNVIVCGVSCLI